MIPSIVAEGLAIAIRAQHAAARIYDTALLELQAAVRRGTPKKHVETLRAAADTARAAWLARRSERREAAHLFELAALVQPRPRRRAQRSKLEIPT